VSALCISIPSSRRGRAKFEKAFCPPTGGSRRGVELRRLTYLVNSPLTLSWHAACDDEIGAARAYTELSPPAA